MRQQKLQQKLRIPRSKLLK
jgi:hypothetical protein